MPLQARVEQSRYGSLATSFSGESFTRAHAFSRTSLPISPLASRNIALLRAISHKTCIAYRKRHDFWTNLSLAARSEKDCLDLARAKHDYDFVTPLLHTQRS